MGLVPAVHRDQVGGQRLYLAAVAQAAGVNAAHPGYPLGQRLDEVRGVPFVAENQHIEVDLFDLRVEQQHGRHVVERAHHRAAAEHGGRLLSGAALGHRQRVGAAVIKADRVHAVDHDLAVERTGQPSQQFGVALPGHRRDHQVGGPGRILVGRPGHLRRGADGGRSGFGTPGVPRADDHPVARPWPAGGPGRVPGRRFRPGSRPSGGRPSLPSRASPARLPSPDPNVETPRSPAPAWPQPVASIPELVWFAGCRVRG